MLTSILRLLGRIAGIVVNVISGPLGPPKPPGPRISVVSPLGGWPGSFVTINGSGFSPKPDENGVVVGGAPALIVRAAPNQLQVIAGETAGTGPVRVTVDGRTATAPAQFELLPWAEEREGQDGAPQFFHGPQHGTPALKVKDQRVLVMLCAPKDDAPAAPGPERTAEEASFHQADRFWREASYHETSFGFEFVGWLPLPEDRSFYIWSQGDVDWARQRMLRWTKRHSAATGNHVLTTNLLGVFSVVDISNPLAPFEIANIPALGAAMHVAVNGSVAYVASGDGGLFVLDLTPLVPTIIRKIPAAGWLHALDVSGNTLVVAALGAGIHVYDVSTPNNPQFRSTLALGGRWATCVRLAGNRAYVGANSNTHPEYGARVSVVDVTNRSAPVELGAVNIANPRAWVLGLDVAGNTCVAATDGDGMQVFDVSGPTPSLRGVDKSILRLHGVALTGGAALGAGADAGFIVWDISDRTNPKKTSGMPIGDCLGVTVSGSHAYLAISAIWLSVVVLGDDPLHPESGPQIDLTDGNWMPPDTGVSANGLRPLVRNAIQFQGMIKHDALYIHGIQKATALGVRLEDYEGVIAVIHGEMGRGQSGLRDDVWFQGTTIKFNGTKGVIWLPSGSHWGRKAHEIGHWFKMADNYEEVQSDGTIKAGTAQHWDMAGTHNEGPLFCGQEAARMKLYDPANVVRKEWEPGTGAKHEPFDIVAHDVSQDGGDGIHLLELVVADGLSYFIEVRQRPGSVIFDQQVPVPPGALNDGAVLVTRAVTKEVFFNNTFERSSMLFGVLTFGQSVVDPPRLLRIEAQSILNARPLTYRVFVHWNEVPPDAGPDGPIDLTITPWNTDTWETPDIWINSELNDIDKTPAGRRYQFCEPGKPEVPVLNGDPPWIRRPNTVFARIRNSGPQQANNVVVSFATTSPPGIGDNGRTPDGNLIAWVTQEIKTIPSIAANHAEIVEFTWTPSEDKHTCILITIAPQLGEKETEDNNSARENVATFDSRGSSSHEPVILDADVRSPFTVVRNVTLRVRGLPDGWHAVVDHGRMWVEPQGTKPVRVVAWTDLHSPRDRKHRVIPAFAAPRVEGWTDLDHLTVPIGGILMPIRANARATLRMEVRPDVAGLVVDTAIVPAANGVPITAEITDRLGERTLLHGITGATGEAVMIGRFAPGTYLVQVFSASTAAVGSAETRQVTFVVR